MIDWIRLFNALDMLVIVVTNQRGVALELMTESTLNDIHRRMAEELASAGARIDDVFCCIHAENACECRKPRPGMILAAARKWDIDLTQSLLIGDSDSDCEAARRVLACSSFACGTEAFNPWSGFRHRTQVFRAHPNRLLFAP